MKALFGIDWQAIDSAVGNQPGVHVVHPGEVLRDLLVEMKLTQTQFAELSGWSLPHVCNIIRGRTDVGYVTALKLEAPTGVRAEVWLHLQMTYSLNRLRGAS